MTAQHDDNLREWAIANLEELRTCLRQDQSIYAQYGALAFETIENTIDQLRERVLKNETYVNPAYARQGDLAAGLIVLGMEYPQDYTQLLANVVEASELRTFRGACWLYSVLNSLSDDHDYVLVKDEEGIHRVCHEFKLPEGSDRSLTCSRDLAHLVATLLEQRGFELSETGPGRG